jgi:hypothetical protein
VSAAERARLDTAHLTDDEPEEVVVFCRECDEREAARQNETRVPFRGRR